jgi:MFS family permease
MVSDASKRNVLLASAFGSSLAPFMVSSLIVALPTIGHEFSGNPELLGWLTSIFFIASAIFLVPFGRVADKYGVKKLFTLGMAVYFLSALLCAFAPGITFLIAARFITGIGAGMIFGTSIALLSLVFPESERGRAIGINVTAMSVGFLLGFFFGGFLTFYAGWRSIFLVTLPVELFVIVLIMTRIRGECELSLRRKPDIPGMLLYCLTIAFIMVGFSTLPGTTGIVLIAGGIVSLLLFVYREIKTTVPIIDVRIFWKNRTFSATNLTVLLFNTSNFAVIFLISLYLQDVRGLDARVAGIILLTPVIFMALLSAFAGRLSDRKPPRIVIGSGILLGSAGLLLYTRIDATTPMPLIVIALALVGTGIALSQSPLIRTTMSSVSKDVFGLASGLIETMRLVGMTFSIAISIIVFGFTLGIARINTSSGPEFTQSLRTIFTILFVVSLCSFLIALTLTRRVSTGGPGAVPA